jgi:osmotically inducible lipoprotein OsmB
VKAQVEKQKASAAELQGLISFTKDLAMKLRHILIATTCTAALAMGGCASNPTNAQVGTGVGAVVGGAAGNAVFGGPVGTIGGAAAGALIGHEIGEDRDQRRGYRR